MEVTEYTLESPASIHLRELAESTSHVYKLLQPWCLSEHHLAIFKPIKLQALSYVQAIDFSIVAAQNGFNFCEDVIAFADLLDMSNELERQTYLRGMVGMAQQAANNAEKALTRFRNVRTVVSKLVEDARRQQHMGESDTTLSSENRLKQFEDGVFVLERFYECISMYISWWTSIHMGQKSQVIRQNNVVVKYNSIRQLDVMKKWKELRQEYVVYTYKIQSIKDANPDFETHLKKARFVEQEAATSVQTDPHAHGSHPKSTRPPSELKTDKNTAEAPRPLRFPRLKDDRSENDLTGQTYVEPVAMLFAPIASIHKNTASRSSGIGHRFLSHFRSKH